MNNALSFDGFTVFEIVLGRNLYQSNIKVVWPKYYVN